MVQDIVAIASSHHLDLFQFTERGWNSQIARITIEFLHRFLQEIIDPVPNDQCYKLNKKFC